MDINALLKAWKRSFRNEYTYTRLPSQDIEAKIPEPTYDSKNESDSDFSESEAPENAENSSDHEVNDALAAHEAHEAPDNSETGNGASHNGKDTNPDNGIARRFQTFGRLASGWVTAGAKAAATKVKAVALQAQDSILSAIKTLKEKGVIDAAKDLRDWVREHPWKTALVVVPLVATACAAITLLAIGFGPGGVAAGSAAAAIQAGIGNVVAHSLFATCTSAMMGGYGAPIIFGGTWVLTLVATAAAKRFWRWWNSPNERRLVRMQTGPSRTVLESLDKAAETVIFNSAVVATLVVYYVKSWMQARRQRREDQTPLL